MERQPDRCGAGHLPRDCRPSSSTAGRRRVRGPADPNAIAPSARQRIFAGAAEAKLTALACSEPPKGRARWTLRLLEDEVVELNIVPRVSDNTIGRTQENILKPHLKEQWVILPDANAAFVGAWKTCWRFITGRMIRIAPWSAWTRPRGNSSLRTGANPSQAKAPQTLCFRCCSHTPM